MATAAPPPNERSRAQLLDDLGRINRLLARYRMPPLIDVDTAACLDDLDLAAVVRASSRKVAEVVDTLGRYG